MNEKWINVIKKPGEMAMHSLNALKGRDVEGLIEAFSSEVTLVIEGISQDQEALRRENAQLCALAEQQEKQLTQLALEQDVLKQRMHTLEKQLEYPKDRQKKPIQTNVLRQVTWIVGIASFTLLAVTIINLFH